MNESAREGLETLAERGEARGATQVLDGARGAVRRHRSRARAALVVAVLLVVGVVAGVVATRDDGGTQGGREIATQPTTGEDAAPPEDDAPLTLYLSDRVLSTSGGEIGVIVRNRGADDWVGGYGVSIDRWDAGEWTEVDEAPDPDVPRLDVGLRAPAEGVGVLERVSVPPLEPGWYRLRKEGAPGAPAGTLQVVDGAVTLVDLTEGPVPLAVQPALIERSDSRTLTIAWPEDVAINSVGDPTAKLEHWDGRWLTYDELDFVDRPDLDAWAHVVALPDGLPSGAYRLSSNTIGAAYFFVDAEDPAAQGPPDDPNAKIFLSDTVLPVGGGEVIAIVRGGQVDAEEFWQGNPQLQVWADGRWTEMRSSGTGFPTVPFTGTGNPWIDPWRPIRLRIGQPPGWYRLRLEVGGAVLHSRPIEITALAAAPLELPSIFDAGFAVDPPFVGQARLGSTVLALRPFRAYESDPSAPALGEEFADSLQPGARLEFWNGQAWQFIADLDVRDDTADAAPGMRWVDLPVGLDPGAHRVVRTSTDGASVVALFWVRADPESPAPTTQVAPGRVTLFLSDTVIPSTGADVIAIVRNNSDADVSFGLGVVIERDDGTFVMQVPASTLLPAFGAPPGGDGAPERLSIPRLDPGRYRLRKDLLGGGSVVADIRVSDAAVTTIDLGDVTTSRLSISPALSPRPCQGGICTLRVGLALAEMTDLASFEASLDPVARYQRWDGTRWVAAGELDFAAEDSIQFTPPPGERIAHMPEGLTPGAYRVIRTGPNGTELTGVFFVE